jgi:hypothetical protein
MIPTRSQIEAYTTDHLVDAADYWDGLADRWEDAHWQVRNQAHALTGRALLGCPAGADGVGLHRRRRSRRPTARNLTHRPPAGR